MRNKVVCLIQNPLADINRDGLLKLQQEYKKFLESNPFPKPAADADFLSMLHYFKRKDEAVDNQIGPYKHITVFEAANRIATDMVIINGLLQLIEQEERFNAHTKVTVRLGNTHVKSKGDFTIDGMEGEAFNVAPSFFYSKLSMTRKKWLNKDELKYILVNDDAFEGKEPGDTMIIKVLDWGKWRV